MEIVIASVICSIMVSAVTSIIITREYMSVTQNEVDRMFNMSIKLVEDVAKMMADRFEQTRNKLRQSNLHT